MNPALPPASASASAEPSLLFRCGTLTYTRGQLARLFFWLLWGDFCFVLMENVVPSLMPLTFKALDASNSSIGLILVTIPMAINTVCNPVISFRSDRFRSRWGRRIPFILFTLPFLVISLLALSFADRIGFWLHGSLGETVRSYSPKTVAIVVIGTVMVLFSFFNTFVNSAFWYLFNDVVPSQYLGRFMSWFRTVSLLAASAYNLLIFPYAGTHLRAILIGVGVLYFFGFGAMCLKVKEGEYAPPPADQDGRAGFLFSIRTFFVECHTHAHYWYVFLGSTALAFSSSMLAFYLFFYQATGMSLTQIGQIQSVANVANAILIVGSGWLADRYHPTRVVLAGHLSQLFLVLPALCIFIFWHPSTPVAFWTWMSLTLVLLAPSSALIGVADPPLLMRLFPRERYGQFCSANAMWRSLGSIFGGVLAGVFLDVLRRHTSVANVYVYLPVWQLVFYIPVAYAGYKVYRSWKQYGGDEAYEPPLPGPKEMLRVSVPSPAAIAGTEGSQHGVEAVIAAANAQEINRR